MTDINIISHCYYYRQFKAKIKAFPLRIKFEFHYRNRKTPGISWSLI